VSIKAFIFF